MKKLIFFISLITSLSTLAQIGMGNRGMGRQRMGQMNQTPNTVKPKFEVDKYLGIVIYEIEKVAKKSGIKLSSETGKQFKNIITDYNKRIKDFRRINSFTLRNTKEMVESFQKTAQESKDFSGYEAIQKKMAENLKPIAETLKNEDIKLNTIIKKLLSEKQYKKWIKYNRKKRKFFPTEEDKE